MAKTGLIKKGFLLNKIYLTERNIVYSYVTLLCKDLTRKSFNLSNEVKNQINCCQTNR